MSKKYIEKTKIEKKENISVSAIECEYLKKTLTYQENEVLHINIKYPQIIIESKEYKNAEQKINEFYEKTAKNFMTYAEKKLYKSATDKCIAYERNKKNISENDNETEVYTFPKFKPFGAILNFCIAYNKESTLSIYLEAVIYTGKGRGKVERMTQCWKLADKECVYLYPHDILKLDKKKKMKICEIITAQIESKIQKNEEYFIHSDFSIVAKYFNAKNFYLHENGYVFYYPQGILTPPDSGIVEFTIKPSFIVPIPTTNL